jgi:hypothetical protein
MAHLVAYLMSGGVFSGAFSGRCTLGTGKGGDDRGEMRDG